MISFNLKICLGTDENDGINSTAEVFVHKLKKGQEGLSFEPRKRNMEREVAKPQKVLFLYFMVLEAALLPSFLRLSQSRCESWD